MNTPEEIEKREAARMERIINRSNQKAKHVESSGTTSTGKWHIHLIGFPTSAGNPVSLLINNKKVYESADDGTEVKHVVEEPIEGDSATVTLQIPEMEFTHTVEYKRAAGENIKFEFSTQGLKMAQQSKPF